MERYSYTRGALDAPILVACLLREPLWQHERQTWNELVGVFEDMVIGPVNRGPLISITIETQCHHCQGILRPQLV